MGEFYPLVTGSLILTGKPDAADDGHDGGLHDRGRPHGERAHLLLLLVELHARSTFYHTHTNILVRSVLLFSSIDVVAGAGGGTVLRAALP